MLVEALDLRLQAFPLLPEKIQQTTHARAQLLIGILQDLWHLPSQAGQPFAKTYASLQQESSTLIDHAGPASYQPVAHPMQSLQIELILGLDEHETHVLALHR